ncbi:MAG: Trypsin-like peptidase domain [Blastocatellia bacterium]|jgi:S1-C subfamily serine protease|nr:Trypsin-like peptidase domain [Blastocatellia bacterium]
MKRLTCSFAFIIAVVSLLAPECAADDPLALVLKQEGHTVSLDLKFTKKSQSSLEHVIAFLDYGPNGHATGFVVGDGLVMTAYHVVSGDLSAAKKMQLGFAPKDQLKVKVYINGCQATVIKVDEAADLALLHVCQSQKQAKLAAFQTSLNQDEKLLLIARPHGSKTVRRGIFYGLYQLRGQEYLSAKLDVRDGYSGSPVYNERAELVGVFSGYDWSKKLALISPGTRAQKMLEEYSGAAHP